MVIFENSGEIDIRSISLFGVSIKDSDNSIGFFGTGLKYAIAVLLREKQSISILSGTTLIVFKAVKEIFRGEEIEVVIAEINGSILQLGFTLQLGRNWDLWMAYRELACNCIDEGGSEYTTLSTPDAEIGKTIITVEGREFGSIFSGRNEYIIQDLPDIVLGAGLLNIHKHTSNYFFNKNVRVFQLHTKSLYTYNSLKNVHLTEDRTLADEYDFRSSIANSILGSTDKEFIRSILIASDVYEQDLDFHGWSVKPTEEFLDTVEWCIKDRYTETNPSAIRLHKELRQKVKPLKHQITTTQTKMLNKATKFCTKLGYNIGEYPVVVVEELGKGCLGLAKDNTIYITIECFEMGGTKLVASTLIEEFLHLKHGYSDKSRELQNCLLNKIVSLGEELFEEPL